MNDPPIDRKAVVTRHNPLVTGFDPFSPLSVGNGEFAFTADATGLQTFPEVYADRFPLCTVAHWGWHSEPMPDGLRAEDVRYTDYDTYGRPVGYLTDRTGQEALFDHLRQNPHRLHLGRIGFVLAKADGAPAAPADLENVRQTLELWSGVLRSEFALEGVPVRVVTTCHPDLDLLSVRVASPLIASGRLSVRIAFPYGSPEADMADWDSPERHRTTVTRSDTGSADLARQLDADTYAVRLAWSDGAELAEDGGPHTLVLRGSGPALELVCHFAPTLADGALPTLAQTEAASAAHWERFWSTGGAIDLGGSTDPRAPELERRVVLSQFVTALHCAGSLPAQETGLLFNSWYGKFHLEMHWWHSVHFAAWGRFPLFARTIGYYRSILGEARAIAARQGYAGARWPKMVGPDGRDAPSPVGPLLIWQQPHPIYYAELCWREQPDRATLEAWADVVSETAAFMASYAVWDGARFVLGPPLKSVSENTNERETRNPTFELAYWRFGLTVAQQWRERLGLPREPEWDRVLAGLAPLPTNSDGVYLLQEGMDDTYTRWNWEHPGHLGAFGLLPESGGADPETMRRTVRRVMETWQWEKKSWGWDFPLTAMAAARAGEPSLAVDALLLDVAKNRYALNGHVYQREGLTAYLPANGGLLAAVAMMAAGWTGAPDRHAPGFPGDGAWTVRWEGLNEWL